MVKHLHFGFKTIWAFSKQFFRCNFRHLKWQNNFKLQMLIEHILLLMCCAATLPPCPFQFLWCGFTIWFQNNFRRFKTTLLGRLNLLCIPRFPNQILSFKRLLVNNLLWCTSVWWIGQQLKIMFKTIINFKTQIVFTWNLFSNKNQYMDQK